jgi:hypothetical protein
MDNSPQIPKKEKNKNLFSWIMLIFFLTVIVFFWSQDYLEKDMQELGEHTCACIGIEAEESEKVEHIQDPLEKANAALELEIIQRQAEACLIQLEKEAAHLRSIYPNTIGATSATPRALKAQNAVLQGIRSGGCAALARRYEQLFARRQNNSEE